MSQDAPESNQRRLAGSAAAPAPEAAQEFDLLAFWILHQKLVIRLLLAALLGVAIWGAFLFSQYRRRTGSENALAHAAKTEDFRKVTTAWAGTPAAGTAYLRLAEELRKENQPKEAAGVLREYLEKYPVHPLRVPAAHALAASLESAGDFEGALAAYRNFETAHLRSAFAPLGLLGQARVLSALGRPDEARQILETVSQRFPGNPFAYEARTLLDAIKNPAGTKTGGAPRPTPIPAPAETPKPVVTPDPTPAPPKPPAKNPKDAAAPPAPAPPSTPAAPAPPKN